MDKGFYIPPTVFHDVKQDSTLWNEEIFGPVLAVRSVLITQITRISLVTLICLQFGKSTLEYELNCNENSNTNARTQVRTFRTEKEAIQEANKTEYGLANAVLSGDLERASRVSRRLDSGIVWANCNQVIHPSTPFGGMKKSGFGREFGELGLHEYLTEKTIVEAEPGVAWWWYGRDS